MAILHFVVTFTAKLNAMPNLRSTILMLFICSGLIAQAQPKQVKLKGHKCPSIAISDPGEFYSTYNFSDNDLHALDSAGLKNTVIDNIIAHHTETSWPGKLASLDERIANPDILKSYVVYKVAEINNMVVVLVPAKYNSDKPEGWALTEDVYFILSKAGVNL